MVPVGYRLAPEHPFPAGLPYPSTDPAMTSASIVDNGAGYFLAGYDMSWSHQQYLPAGPAAVAAILDRFSKLLYRFSKLLYRFSKLLYR